MTVKLDAFDHRGRLNSRVTGPWAAVDVVLEVVDVVLNVVEVVLEVVEVVSVADVALEAADMVLDVADVGEAVGVGASVTPAPDSSLDCSATPGSGETSG